MGVKEYKQHKKKHHVYAITVIILGLAIFALSFFLLFYVQKIEVVGTTYSSQSEINQWIKKDELSFNSLYVVWAYNHNKNPLPYLDSVKVKLTAPWSVKVTIKEKPIVAGIIAEDQYVYFDQEGLVLLSGGTLIEGIPLIDGMVISNPELYKKLPTEEQEVFEDFLKVSEFVQKYELTVDKIRCVGTDMELHIGTIVVKLGNDNFDNKMMQIPPILERLAGETGTVHLEHYGQGSDTISFMRGELPVE